MSVSKYVSKEWNKFDKRRTVSLLGFLVILAFFPLIFSSSSQEQDTRSEAAPLTDFQTITPTTATQPQQGQPPQGQPSQQPQQGTQLASPSALPAQVAYPAPEQPPYSPQPSIWLFLIPVAVTFFTILFY